MANADVSDVEVSDETSDKKSDDEEDELGSNIKSEDDELEQGQLDTSWIDELRKSLLSACNIQTIRKICNYNPVPDSFRADIWKICLGISKKENGPMWDEIFDRPEQALIRQDCQNLVDKLGNEEEDKLSVVCDIESVITKFCKETAQIYSSRLKWLELLEPLIALNFEKADVYCLFRAIHKLYIHRNLNENYNPFHLFRLLLLYHEPELCLFLDTKKISPDLFAFDWFASLFSSSCPLKCIQMMWDIYFQQADPFFIYFLSLVIVINEKDQLLDLKEVDRQSIIDVMSSLPSDLETNDIKDFCTVALYLLTSTPQSFRKLYRPILFQTATNSDLSDSSLSQALCLPVSVQDLVSKSQKYQRVKFFVVDCRPADQYNSGHLSTAFHLDASLMLQEPAAFGTAVDALLAAKDQSIAANSVAAGDQICFMGSGREEEDQYVHMVIASFLQKHQKYVSLAHGGYAALHELLADNLDAYLVDHCPRTCLVCKSKTSLANGIEGKENSIFDKLASAVRARGEVVRGRLVEYITNPQTTEDRCSTVSPLVCYPNSPNVLQFIRASACVPFRFPYLSKSPERFYPHVSCSDRLGRRYRGIPPVFSIDDELEVGERSSETEEETCEEVNVETWKNKPDVIGSFECNEFTESGISHPSYLIITDTHMYVLRLNPQKKGYAFIVARRLLANIVKITSKRRYPEIITFKHGSSEEDEDRIVAMDHLLIPKAGDATRLIKYHIYRKNDTLIEK